MVLGIAFSFSGLVSSTTGIGLSEGFSFFAFEDIWEVFSYFGIFNLNIYFDLDLSISYSEFRNLISEFKFFLIFNRILYINEFSSFILNLKMSYKFDFFFRFFFQNKDLLKQIWK